MNSQISNVDIDKFQKADITIYQHEALNERIDRLEKEKSELLKINQHLKYQFDSLTNIFTNIINIHD